MEALEEEYPGLQVYADYQYWVEGDDMGDEDGKSEESEEEEEGDK